MNFNQVNLGGNLTRDPKLKYLPNQTAVADFGMAINRRWKTAGGEEKEDVTFVEISAFGKLAEIINQHFTKGAPIFISGRLKYDTWDDRETGGKRQRLSVIADQFQFIGAKKSADDAPLDGGDAAPDFH